MSTRTHGFLRLTFSHVQAYQSTSPTSPILDLAATGVNGAPLASSAPPLPLPAGASLSGASGLFTFTPDATQVGDIALSFIVNDGLASDSEAIIITVVAPGRDD